MKALFQNDRKRRKNVAYEHTRTLSNDVPKI